MCGCCRGRREVLGVQKVGGLVRLIKGKAEGGTGSLPCLGLRFDVRVGKKPSHGRPK